MKKAGRKTQKNPETADLIIGSEGVAAENRTSRLRTRAAWMYYVEQMTQNDIAEALGVGRVTIVRLLADARARNEVKITIEGKLASLTSLEVELEKTFGLDRAIVAPPSSSPDIDPIPPISAATGAYLSEKVQHGMTIGWLGTYPFQHPATYRGAPAQRSESHFPARRHRTAAPFKSAGIRLAVCALIFQGEGVPDPAPPALVDSKETRIALIERCGLNTVLDMAEELDMVLLSVGDIQTASSTSYRVGLIDEAQKLSLIENGAVGDVLFHFYDKDGKIVDDPVHDRVMSAKIESLQKTPQRILTSGGKEKIAALLGAIKLLKPTVLITDEESAAQMLREMAQPE
ncbi:hypothetical protein Q644_05015 [Brucella intermedia 229E]|uniref:Sugar-binding domain-containing protein n=1 Tax=Brucella intermedia 229E TaxID=1337887 RepID=U4VCD4_9HYPH|nr:hypothetical protein Q644_05015 [Brucella intermedia 229E]